MKVNIEHYPMWDYPCNQEEWPLRGWETREDEEYEWLMKYGFFAWLNMKAIYWNADEVEAYYG